MTAAETVRALLLTLSPVTTLVSGRIWTQRFPQSLKDTTLPAVLVQQVSDVQTSTLRGTSGLVMARVQIDVVARTIAAARLVDQAILGDYTGGGSTGLRGASASVGSPAQQIFQATAENYNESYEGDELKLPRVTRDYRVWYGAD